MKIKRETLIVFLAVLFIPLTCAGGFAEMDVGGDYSLGGQISVGGGWLSDQPRHMNRGYLKEYVPFEQGFLAETDLSLQSKEGLDYYRFWMSNPGLRGAQDFLLQVGKIGVYHAQIEYDELQHLYCTVNPSIFANNNIGILLKRLRFSGYYSPTPEITIFAEDQFLRRTGFQPSSYVTGPGNPYNFTTTLRAIQYSQNDLKVGVEYDRPTDEKSPFQGRVSYHLSTFENGNALMQNPAGNAFITLPPSNMANYVTGEGALDLKDYKTRITGSLTYGWLSQNDYVFDSTNSAGPPSTVAGRFDGLAGLGASTFTANIAGVSRPSAPLTLRYGYNAYNFENNNTANSILATAFSGGNQPLLRLEQYSYLRQGVNLGADYRVNNMLAFTTGFTWQGVARTNAQGTTQSSSPQVGLRLSPTDWLSLNANYAYTSRIGSNFLTLVTEAGEPTTTLVPLTYKFYSGNLNRNNFNFIAELLPVNNITTSFNFSIYNDNFLDSGFGIQSDRGWSTGADVSWRPHDRVALSLGYDHQQLQTKELAVAATTIGGESANVIGDAGSTLTTSDSYDTFSARADFKLIPKKLDLTTRASYSIAHSNFNNSIMLNLNEYYADIRTFLTYRFNEHWACKAGYIFEAFGMPKAYQTLYLQGVTAAGAAGVNQRYNTLDGFYTNATAHLVQAFLQYKF
jgi:hypothetical protein